MFKSLTLKSFLIYVASLIVAEAAFLQFSSVKNFHDVLSFPVIMGMIVTWGGVTVPWASYSPLNKPYGSPTLPTPPEVKK